MRERRREARARLCLAVLFLVGAEERNGTLLDLSLRGARLHAALPPAAGSAILILVPREIHLVGAVAWCSGPRFGVRFGALESAARDWIASQLA